MYSFEYILPSTIWNLRDMANGEDVILAMGGTSCQNPVEVRRLITEKRRGESCSNNEKTPKVRGQCRIWNKSHPRAGWCRCKRLNIY